MNPRDVKVCAHRGASATHPENTKKAFDEAIRVGAHMLEFDARRTRDGRFVVMHDRRVDRTTNGAGAVDELDFDTIRGLDAGEGQRVPTLDEAMAYADRAILNVHAYPESDRDLEAMAEAFLAHFARHECYDRAFITSGTVRLLEVLRLADERIRLCNLYGQQEEDYPAAATSLVNVEIIQPNHGIVTPELVARAHERRLKVNPFYADDEAEMRRLLDCGVDGILTNYPERLVKLLAALAGPA